MPELELALRQLAGVVEFPPEPDLAGSVRLRLGEAPRRRFAPRRIAMVALAVLVVSVGAAMVVPSARTAVLEWLGIKGVKVTRVETLPKVSLLNDFGLGERVSLAEARQRAPWLVEPHLDSLDPPDQIYYSKAVPFGQVSFLWGSKTEVQLLLTQATGEAFAEKMIGLGTDVEATDVDDRPGAWFTGDFHVFLYRDRRGKVRNETARLARNTLLWQHDEVTVRLEGELSKDEALEIARSVR